MGTRLLKTEMDVFQYLCETKTTLQYKAQEAKDLGNPKGAAHLREAAAAIDQLTKIVYIHVASQGEV